MDFAARNWLIANDRKAYGQAGRQASPPAQFRQPQKSQQTLTPIRPKPMHTFLRQPAPLPPIVSLDTSDRNQKILIGSLAGMLVVMVLAWLLWPATDVATGMSSSGTGDGASDSGAEQSANEQTDSETGETTPTSASAAGTDIADVGAAESAEVINDGIPLTMQLARLQQEPVLAMPLPIVKAREKRPTAKGHQVWRVMCLNQQQRISSWRR